MNCRDNLLEKAFKEAITQAQRYANPPWCDIFTQSRRLENVEMLLETLSLSRAASFFRITNSNESSKKVTFTKNNIHGTHSFETSLYDEN